MSYPVFLNAASEPRIPDGSKNEWKAFWSDGATELEGDGWPPLLWLALFTAADIRWARLVDDEDLDSEGREELEEFADTTYPYLVASRDSALSTLASRKKVILDGVGQHFSPVLESFEALLNAKFTKFVLCRTSGICDVADAGPALEKNLVDFDRLASQDHGNNNDSGSNDSSSNDSGNNDSPGHNSIVAVMKDLRRQSAGAQRFLLVGVEHGVVADDELPAEQPARVQAPEKKAMRRSSALLDWVSALIVGLPAVATYLRVHSVVLAAVTFCVMVAIVVLVRVKLLRR